VATTEPEKGPVLRGHIEQSQAIPIDLATVIDLTERQNLTLAQEKLSAKIAHSRLRQNQAKLLPNVRGLYNTNTLQTGVPVFGSRANDRILRRSQQPALEANVTLHPGGRTLYEIRSAKRRKAASTMQVEETLQQQLARAVEDYYRVL
jgi:outer membrane protein TolC